MSSAVPGSDSKAEPKSELRSEAVSRTSLHVVGAVLIAVGMGVGLALAPTCGRAMRERQIAAVQQGALVDLKLVHDQEKLFLKEYGFYTTDLNRLGIAPKKVVYKFGFVRAGDVTDAGVDPKIKDLDALRAFLPKLNMDYSPLTKLAQIDFSTLEAYCPDCTATRTSFKAIAVANLDQDNTLDVWTVDQDGNYVHVINDLK